MATIIYAHPGAELYGSDRMALETVLTLTRAGHTVRVVLPENGPLADLLRDENVPVSLLNVPVLRKAVLTPMKLVAHAIGTISSTIRISRLIRETGATVVFANTIVQPTWIFAGRLSGRRVICHVREAEKHLHGLVQKMLFLPIGLAHTVIANSASTLRSFHAHTIFQPNETLVIYNGKNWDHYFESPPRPMPKDPHLVVVGRLSPRKGQDVVVDALAELASEGMRPTVTFVGDTFPGYEWYVEELKASIARHGLDQQCAFAGFNSDTAPFLATADIVVVPSRQEPFGTVAAEGLAAMRATIATNTGGLPEIVADRETGLLVEPADVADLVRAIRTLVEDPELALRLAETGFASVSERFSAESYAHEIRQVVAAAPA